MYMQEEERFPYLIGRMLERDLDLKVNTLNGGTAGNPPCTACWFYRLRFCLGVPRPLCSWNALTT